MINDFDVHKFVKENYEPVEDKPGYVWFNKRAMQIINIDTLISSLEEWKSKQTSELGLFLDLTDHALHERGENG